MRLLLVFLVLFMVIGVNLPESMIARLGFEPGFLKAALAAWVVAGLTFHERTALIVVVVALTIGANLPAGAAARLGIDPDVSLAALVALVLLPLLRHHLE